MAKAGTVWTRDELLWLVQARHEIQKSLKSGGGKKRKVTPTHFNQLVYERYVELAGGSSSRTPATIVTRAGILQNSYAFIRSYQGKKKRAGNNDWFALSTSEQRSLMKTEMQRVQPIDERVFQEMEKFVGDGKEDEADEADEKSESESGESVVSEVFESEGDIFEIKLHEKKPAAPKKKKKKKKKISVPPRSGGGPNKASKSALESEAGELFEPKGAADAKSKRRRVKGPNKPLSSDDTAKEILERQSEKLAGFLEKRAEERTREHERSREEREADQKFWATETAKDRALLRDLFTQKK